MIRRKMGNDGNATSAAQVSEDGDRADTAKVDCTIVRVKPLEGTRVYALIDIELNIAGVLFGIRGIQARHLSSGGTSIHLPMFRDTDGQWRGAVVLPVELRDALADQILNHLVELGVAQHKSSGSRTPDA
jgi:hypothetical protein